MTMHMTDLEIIEQIPFVEDDDDHTICSECYPGYNPDIKVIALCGKEVDDCEPDANYVHHRDATCKLCSRVVYCPICGDEL